jgi:hypothetical protein
MGVRGSHPKPAIAVPSQGRNTSGVRAPFVLLSASIPLEKEILQTPEQ